MNNAGIAESEKGLYLGTVDKKSEIRCPHCFKKHGDGKYPDEPQEIKCTRCGKFFIIQRIK